MHMLIGVPGWWGGGVLQPLQFWNFSGKSAYDSGKSTWDKLLFIESGFYNTTKRSILKSFNGSAANLLSAGNC